MTLAGSRVRAVGVLVGVLLVVGQAPAIAVEQEPPPTASGVNLADPDAGITDPLRGVTPLTRDCADGQTDVNAATADQIAQAFGLTSSPTVDRIIAGRPWLTPLDLLSVPGAALSRASVNTLRHKGCATPLQLPEPAPMACVRSEQIDLQSATATEVAKGLGLPKNTANAIVANRPVDVRSLRRSR